MKDLHHFETILVLSFLPTLVQRSLLKNVPSATMAACRIAAAVCPCTTKHMICIKILQGYVCKNNFSCLWTKQANMET
jgi:hypothetical protein